MSSQDQYSKQKEAEVIFPQMKAFVRFVSTKGSKCQSDDLKVFMCSVEKNTAM